MFLQIFIIWQLNKEHLKIPEFLQKKNSNKIKGYQLYILPIYGIYSGQEEFPGFILRNWTLQHKNWVVSILSYK